MNVDASNLNQLADELLTLPTSSRAYLAERLSDSVQFESDDIRAAWEATIERRMSEYEQGNVQAIASEDVFREARRRLDEARQISS